MYINVSRYRIYMTGLCANTTQFTIFVTSKLFSGQYVAFWTILILSDICIRAGSTVVLWRDASRVIPNLFGAHMEMLMTPYYGRS